MKKIKIHFVCRGNAFRSRIAEAYAKSFNLPGYEFSSSGIEADKYYPENFLSPWAMMIGKQHRFEKNFSATQTQTTNELLQSSDLIIFMHHDVHRDALERFDFNDDTSTTWSVKDRNEWREKVANATQRRRVFLAIHRQLAKYLHDVSHGGWVDIIDENNRARGFALPISLANKKGLWHRGCHAIITTPNGHTVVQKRSLEIMFSPNYLDITLGGHVDAGEKPKTAIMRETLEEIGIPDDYFTIRKLEITKWDSYHPRYKTHSRTYLYSYHIKLKHNNPAFTFQPSEVADVQILSPQKLKHLIRYHRLKGLGRLNHAYKYYERILKQATT